MDEMHNVKRIFLLVAAAFAVLGLILVVTALSEGAVITDDSFFCYDREWKLIQIDDQWQLQNVWDSRRPKLKGYPIMAMTDFAKNEVWYTTEHSLNHELNVIRGGPAEWLREALRDIKGYERWLRQRPRMYRAGSGPGVLLY